jgi:connector enhancer of kinase suppressor of Ras 2
MAYVNVMEWKAEQVAEWLRGLDDAVYPYAHFFLNNDVTGQGLLNLTVDDLYKLHVEKLGHQEIILESLDLLRNFHFHLDQENLQFVCLRLSCKVERVVMKFFFLFV